jgi:biopolymer transport protein ExbD
MVITMPQGLAPIESDSVRISSLGGPEKPFFAWDTGKPVEAAIPERIPIRREYTIDLNRDGRIAFEQKTCDIDELRERIRDLAGKEPDSSFTLQQEPSVEADFVKKVTDLLVESGFDDIETVTVTPTLKEQRLRPEVAETTFIDESTSVPIQIGGRLLWIQGVGNYFLNGRRYDDGSLRQTLRTMGRVSPDIPIILAGPTGTPKAFIKELISDLKAFGFRDVQVAVDSAQANY